MTQMQNKIIILLLLFSGFHSDLLALELEDEDYIPHYAELQQNIEFDNGLTKLKKDTRFVIIRPVSTESMLVEFPRKGIYELPYAVTNVESLVSKNKLVAKNELMVPRMAFFFANRVVSGASDWQNPLRSEDVSKFIRWILLYGDSKSQSTLDAINAASKYVNSLEASHRISTAVIFIDTSGDKLHIENISKSLKPAIHAIPAYLCRGFIRSLAHIESGADGSQPVLVETKASGRIVVKHTNLEHITHFFENDPSN